MCTSLLDRMKTGIKPGEKKGNDITLLADVTKSFASDDIVICVVEKEQRPMYSFSCIVPV